MKLCEKLGTEFDSETVDWVIDHAAYTLGVDELPPTLGDSDVAKILGVKTATVQVWRCTGDRKIEYAKTGRSAINSTVSVLRTLIESGVTVH